MTNSRPNIGTTSPNGRKGASLTFTASSAGETCQRTHADNCGATGLGSLPIFRAGDVVSTLRFPVEVSPFSSTWRATRQGGSITTSAQSMQCRKAGRGPVECGVSLATGRQSNPRDLFRQKCSIGSEGSLIVLGSPGSRRASKGLLLMATRTAQKACGRPTWPSVDISAGTVTGRNPHTGASISGSDTISTNSMPGPLMLGLRVGLSITLMVLGSRRFVLAAVWSLMCLCLLTFLAGCAVPNVNVQKGAASQERRSAPTNGVLASASVGLQVVELPGSNVSIRSVVGPVAYSGLTVCEFFRIVLVEGLAVRGSCDGVGGSLSIFAGGDTGGQRLALALSVLRQAGYNVVSSDGSIIVTGQSAGEGEFAGFSSLPDGYQGGVEADGSSGFVVPIAPIDAAAVGDTIVQDSARSRSILPGQDAGEVSAMVDRLGIDVAAVEVDEGVLVVGPSNDVALVKSVFDDEPFSAYLLSVGAVGDQLLALVEDAAFVTASFDPQSGLMAIHGETEEVIRAVSVVTGLGVAGRDRTVQAAYVYGSDGDFSEFTAQVGFSFRSGDGELRVGSSPDGQAVFASLDASARKAGLAIEERPVLAVTDGVEAMFQSGRDVPVIGLIDEDGRQEITYRSIGTILRVVTAQRPDGFVKVTVYLEVSSVDGVGVSDSPAFSRRSIDTSVVIRPGDVVALSGFTSRRDERRNDRFLGVLPGRFRAEASERLHILLTVQ